MTKNILLGNLVRGSSSITKLLTLTSLPGKTVVVLRRIGKQLVEQITMFEEIRNAKIKEWGESDGTNIQIKPDSENFEKYQKYMMELFNIEIPIDIGESFNIDLFAESEKSELSPADLDLLISLGIIRDYNDDKMKPIESELLKRFNELPKPQNT